VDLPDAVQVGRPHLIGGLRRRVHDRSEPAKQTERKKERTEGRKEEKKEKKETSSR